MGKTALLKLCLLLSLGAVAACKSASGTTSAATPILQPGAPGQQTKTIDTKTATDLSKVGATAADVPAPIRHALLLMVAHWYENREPTDAPTRLPAPISELLAPYKSARL